MGHGPSSEWGEDKASAHKTRLGLWMFLAYCVVYAAFVALCSVWPRLMETPIGSLNLAVAYGFGLIGLALVMAIIYNRLSTQAEARSKGEQDER